MNTLFSWGLAAVLALGLAIGFGSVTTPAYADQHEKDPIEEAEEGGEDDKKDGE